MARVGFLYFIRFHILFKQCINKGTFSQFMIHHFYASILTMPKKRIYDEDNVLILLQVLGNRFSSMDVSPAAPSAKIDSETK